MAASIITLSLVGLASVIVFFTGWLDIAIDTLISLAYRRHQRIRRNKRPARIFLIRHGESEANVDNCKPCFSFHPISHMYFFFCSFVRTYTRE